MRQFTVPLALAGALLGQTRDEVLAAMKKASEFYRNKVSTEGGYHYYYATETTPSPT